MTAAQALRRMHVDEERRDRMLGRQFGKLQVLAFVGSLEGHALWLCRCECGNTRRARGANLRNGHATHCGCDGRVRHGMSKTRTYASWCAMVQRCTNPDSKNWDNYGGRGIKVCAPWLSSFYAFLQDMGERPEGTSLDRVNVNGWYQRGNCRWADATTQANNKRNSKCNQGEAEVPF